MELTITKDNGSKEHIVGIEAMQLCISKKGGEVGYTSYLSIHDHLRALILSTRSLGANSVHMQGQIPMEDEITRTYFDKMVTLLGEYAAALILLEKTITEVEKAGSNGKSDLEPVDPNKPDEG